MYGEVWGSSTLSKSRSLQANTRIVPKIRLPVFVPFTSFFAVIPPFQELLTVPLNK
jgi:hypothetical protein